jgi:hypothetical protein
VRADRLDQLVIGPQEIDAESCSSMEASGGSSRNPTPLAAMSAAVDGLPASVGVDSGEFAAHSAADTSGQQVGSSTPAGDMPPTRCIELATRYECVVSPREPIILDAHLAEVHPIAEQMSSGRVLQAADPCHVGK